MGHEAILLQKQTLQQKPQKMLQILNPNTGCRRLDALYNPVAATVALSLICCNLLQLVANLIEKHGVIPKKCYPETFSNESSRQMNNMLKSKMREFSYDLFNATKKEASDEDIAKMIQDQMKIIHR